MNKPTADERLTMLENHLSESLAGFHRALRSSNKPTQRIDDMTTETKPQRWALVPVEATPEMIDSGMAAVLRREWNIGSMSEGPMDAFYSAAVAASPGAALLAEVMAARDEANETFDHLPFQQAVDACFLAKRRVVAALDKLGPAAEGAT